MHINGRGARFTNVCIVRNSNSLEISPCHNSVAGHQIATNFCTCHDSTVVVPCTTFCSDHCIRIEVRVKRNFHRIWIAMEKPLVKWAPGHSSSMSSTAKLLTTKLCYFNLSSLVSADQTTCVQMADEILLDIKAFHWSVAHLHAQWVVVEK